MGKSKYSNTLKVYAIDNDYIKLYKDKIKGVYKGENFLSDLIIDCHNNKVLDCSRLLCRSKKVKYLRCRKHIEDVVMSKNASFITLTFTDSVLSTTTPLTRRRYVARYLKSQSDKYIANIDYSPDKQREHYHAVILGRVDMSKWSYGFVFAEKVRSNMRDNSRVSNYITKLTSHAFKTDMTRLIYSRSMI